MNRCCACFTTDLGYAFPTLLAAIQARQHLALDQADVVMLLFHGTEPADQILAHICKQKGIVLINAPVQSLSGYSPMYARLFLDELLPAEYQRILYLDGDVQITGTLDGLIRSEFPDALFLAAADPMAMLVHAKAAGGASFAAYFASLKVRSSLATPYFNSGVLLVNRRSWAEISKAALDFLKTKPELCLFQDQSALNAAGHARMLPMSLRWNFPIFFRNCGVERAIAPLVYHFMSKPKPWNAALPPWNKGFSDPYDRLAEEFPSLQIYVQKLGAGKYLRYLAQQNAKRVQEGIVWGLGKRRPAILAFDAAAKF